ncbi:hypothetical protein BH10CHL1_BH10CHL1_41960 [soil metagenome]
MDSREEFQSAQQGIGCMWAMLKIALVVIMLIFLLGVMAGAVVMAGI